jgi:hypothetical protein
MIAAARRPVAAEGMKILQVSVQYAGMKLPGI